MTHLRTVDLRAEAVTEVSRLMQTRARLRDGDGRALAQLEGEAPWIALARRTGRRRSRGDRVHLVWRVAFEDQSGCLVESRLVPVAIDVARIPGKANRRKWILALLQDTDADFRARVDAASEDWRASVVRIARAFTSARIRRERAIAGRAPAIGGAPSQPGLFDRRGERSHLANAEAAAASEQVVAERLRAILALGTITSQRARLLLVLAP